MTHFSEVEFPVIINLAPHQFHKGLYDELEEAVKRKYSGLAHAKIGFIKRDSVRIVSKQIGKYEGSHLTGHMSFHMTVRCQATMPLKDMEIDAIVTTKNDAGLVCKDFRLPYSLFVPNIPGDPDSASLSSINTNDSVRVKVIDSRLKAPLVDIKGERNKPEYWVICRLTSVYKEAVNRLELPMAEHSPTIMVTTTRDMTTVSEEQMRLSGGMFHNLQSTKDVIDSIRKDYIAYIEDSKHNFKVAERDPIIRSLVKSGEQYVIGTITRHADSKTAGQTNASVKIISSSSSGHRVGDQVRFSISGGGQPTEARTRVQSLIEDGSVVLLTGVNNDTARRIRDLDMWLLHVKYIVNPYEMIHITNAYRNQLVNLKVIPDGSVIPYHERAISRAYFKMMEILNVYDNLVQVESGSAVIACIAESPGGFIQALLDARLKMKDQISSISLPPTDSGTWDEFMAMHSKYYAGSVDINSAAKTRTNVNLLEGDLTNKEQWESFHARFAENPANLVTADGGFERDKGSSELEELETAKLILAEAVMALSIQARGGSFVLKIYDMATRFTVDLLSILAYCYEHVSVIKPKSSRPANSEKYVVCTGFKFKQDNDELNLIVEQLQKAVFMPLKDKEYYGSLLAVYDADIRATIIPYNSIFMKKQTETIVVGREYASSYMKHACSRVDSMDCMTPYVQEQLAHSKQFHKEIMPEED